MVKAFLKALALVVLIAGTAWAGYTVDPISLRAVHSLSGSAAVTGTWAGNSGYLNIDGNVDGSARFTYGTLIAGSAPEINMDQLRVIPRGAVSGANDNIRVTFACVAMPLGSDNTITFPTGRSITYDLGTLGCAIDTVCDLTDATAAAIKNDQTGSNCASTTCNNSILVCQVGIDAGVANEYTDTLDFIQVKYTVTP